MARRYNRDEKEKWAAPPTPPPKRPPVRIPANNTEDLVAANRLTIIGRVTNTTLQKPRAVLDFMTQVWNLEGRVDGRVLGLDKFQVKFETETDLRTVLEKGPYHYKRWMLLLQRWEPIVSERFPSNISFCVRIHGIPLHYWHDSTIKIIGEELGPCTILDVKEAKIRVEVNGLQPLIMNMEIELPSADIIEVEFEYIKIEKHCFTCFSLFHEECDCPHRDPRTPAPKGRTLGITQAIALQRIEAEKRRHDERRGFRRSDDSRPPINSHDNRYSQLRRDQPSDNYYYERREDRRQPSIFSRTARPNTSYRRNNGSTMQYRVVDRTRNDAVSHSNQSPLQRSDKRDGEAMNLRRTSTEHAPQNSINTPPPRSVKERLGAPQGTTEDANSGSRDRRSALERISSPLAPEDASNRKAPSFENGRLQEAVLTTEEEGTEHREQELHIEEASQNRVPANLRLGVSKAGPSNKKRGTIPVSTQSKTAGKRKVLRTPRKRVACSPLSGLNIRKSTVINTVSTTRRKLLADRVTDATGSRTVQSTRRTSQRSSNTVFIPGSTRGGVDFRPPPHPLP